MKFQKTETLFCRWKSTDNNDINIFLSLENPCTLYLFVCERKELRTHFNTHSELSKNRAEQQIMSSKITINWLFNDIWCYLFITSFDWKISVFQQTFVRVYFILKYQSGFRESFNTHDYFIKLLEKRNWSLHNAVVFGTLVTDISKVFFLLFEAFTCKTYLFL